LTWRTRAKSIARTPKLRLFEVGREFEKVDRCLGRQSYERKILPSRFDLRLQANSRTRNLIGRDHTEPARKKQSRPTGAGGSGADDCDATYWSTKLHPGSIHHTAQQTG